jgi:serine phosphatase RsbU (regulator of sigma subunit)
MEPAQLTFTNPSGQRQTVTIDESPFRMGRSRQNHLALPGTDVSREHAEIAWEGQQFFLHDLASRAGTFLNDEPIERHPLATGDRIRVGGLELHFSTGSGADADTDSSSGTSTAISDLRQTAALLAGLRAVGSARVLDHVLDLVLDAAIDVSGAERGFIMLVTPAGDLEFRCGRGRNHVSLTGTHFQTSRKIPEDVYRTGTTRLVKDLQDTPTASDHEATMAFGIRQVLCAPLQMVRYVDAGEATGEDRRIGVLYLDSRERQALHSSSMRAAMETLANEAARAIENARLYREAQDRARMDHDLRTAQEFQQALLPKAAPALGFFDAAASMVPCRMIGGDFFEYVSLPDEGALGFTLGDVAGKGAPAGLLGARIQEIFSAHAPALVEPATTIAKINTTLLRRSLEARFVTMVYGILSADGRLRYCNAGHNYPVLVTADGVRRLETGGLIVGLFEEAEFEEETLHLSPGDLLVVFSDGISEAMDAEGEEFGDERIIECVGGADRDPEAVLTRLFEQLHAFTGDEPQGDDMTVLVLRYQGEGLPPNNGEVV